MNSNIYILFFLFLPLASCTSKAQSSKEQLSPQLVKEPVTKVASPHVKRDLSPIPKASSLSATAKSLARQGYTNIKDIDPSIQVSLMYSRPDNFCGEILYDDLCEAYLHPKAAQALKKAQEYLKSIRPDLSLKVYDAARPMHIQQEMWDKVKNTRKYFYVSNPAHGGGMHNYGMAVDISLWTLKGDTLDMGTKIDYMGSAAHIDKERSLVAQGKISRHALSNRLLLREVMRHAGCIPLRTEWWHFNLCSRVTARRYYKVIK